MNEYQPKCDSCVDAYSSKCHCQKSVYYGMALEQSLGAGVPVSFRNVNGVCMTSQRRSAERNTRAWRNLSSECNLKLFNYGKE